MGDFRYEFTIKEGNKTDFQLKIEYNTFYNYYLKLLRKVCNKMDIKAYDELKQKEHFQIPEKYGKVYFPRVRNLINKNIKSIYDEIKLDNIKIINDKIVRMSFKKINNFQWQMIIYLEGLYVKCA